MLFDSKGDNVKRDEDEMEEDESGTLISNGVELACKLKSMELVGETGMMVVLVRLLVAVEKVEKDDNDGDEELGV